MPHGGRCVQITCNFTHPSSQTGHRVYDAKKYTYVYEQDALAVRRDIEKHAKRKYAWESKIRHAWIGAITTTDRIVYNASPDTDRNEHIDLVP